MTERDKAKSFIEFKVTNGIIFINDIIFVLQEGAKVDMQIK